MRSGGPSLRSPSPWADLQRAPGRPLTELLGKEGAPCLAVPWLPRTRAWPSTWRACSPCLPVDEARCLSSHPVSIVCSSRTACWARGLTRLAGSEVGACLLEGRDAGRWGSPEEPPIRNVCLFFRTSHSDSSIYIRRHTNRSLDSVSMRISSSSERHC